MRSVKQRVGCRANWQRKKHKQRRALLRDRSIAMTSPRITSKWIAAGKILAVNPTAQALCPVCSEENLIVEDIPVQGSRKFERIMRCSKCGSQNAILMSK